jgi:CRP-like cAMP-binding protein
MVEYSSQLHEECLPFLDKADASSLLCVMEILEIKAVTPLYVENDGANCMYVLISGRMAVQKQTGFGDRMQVVALLDPGAPLGEGVLTDQSRGATLTAVADSRLLLLSRQAFAEITINTPSLAVKVLTWLMGRLALRLKKSSERLAHVL